MLNLAEFLFEHRGNNTDPRWLADTLGHLVWLTEDNGSLIHQTLESWLASGSLEQAKVALAYDEAALIESLTEAQRVLSSLATRFPELSGICGEVLSRRASASAGA